MLVTFDLKAELKDLDSKLKMVLETAPVVVAYTISAGGLVQIYLVSPGETPLRILRKRYIWGYTPHAFVEMVQQILFSSFCPKLRKVEEVLTPYTVQELNDWYFSNPGADLDAMNKLHHKTVVSEDFTLTKVYTKKDEFLIVSKSGEKILRRSQIPVTRFIQALESAPDDRGRWEYLETKSKEVRRFEGGVE